MRPECARHAPRIGNEAGARATCRAPRPDSAGPSRPRALCVAYHALWVTRIGVSRAPGHAYRCITRSGSRVSAWHAYHFPQIRSAKASAPPRPRTKAAEAAAARPRPRPPSLAPLSPVADAGRRRSAALGSPSGPPAAPASASAAPIPAPPAPTPATCGVCCASELSAEERREAVSAACAHAARSVCDGCLRRHIREEVRGKGNATRIACPEAGCGAALAHHEVQRWAVAGDFEAYDALLLRQLLQRDPDFRWCAGAGCGAGQVHAGGDAAPIVRCAACGVRSCFTHRAAWHDGRTCAQYDADAAASDEVALVQALEGLLGSCRS